MVGRRDSPAHLCRVLARHYPASPGSLRAVQAKGSNPVTHLRALTLTLAFLAGCKHASPECRARTQKLRGRISSIDWSLVSHDKQLPAAEIPVGSGKAVPESETW